MMDETPPRGRLLRDYTPAASSPSGFNVPKAASSAASSPSGFNVPKAASSDQSGVRDRRHPSAGEIRGSGNAMRPLGVGGDPGVSGGAFYTMRTVVSGGADNGDIYLQGGVVTAGTGNPVVDEFLLFDASGPTWTGSAGQLLQLEVALDGQETSGILDPIVNATDTTIVPTVVGALASNSLPTPGSVSGKVCNISLGTFITDGFQPAASGNIVISFCWGGYLHNH